MNAYKILNQYSNGEISLEDANKALKEMNTGFYLDPTKNDLTAEEIKNGTAGLLDTGTGSFDKVQIINGELEYEVNQVNPDGTVNMDAFVLMMGKTFRVEGKKLIET